VTAAEDHWDQPVADFPVTMFPLPMIPLTLPTSGVSMTDLTGMTIDTQIDMPHTDVTAATNRAPHHSHRVAAVCAAVLLATSLFALPPRSAEATTYDYVAGHGDIGLSYNSATDTLRIYLNFDNNSVVQDANGNQLTSTQLNALQNPAGTGEWSMAEFRVVVPASQQFAREPGAAWDIVGVAAGEPYWELPQNNQEGVPFFGFERRPNNLANTTFTLGNVLAAPAGGIISAWQYDNSGENPDLGLNRYWSTAPGSTPSPNAITLTQTHQHFNFGFSQPGLYQFEIIGTTSATTQQALGVLTVNVVPEPSTGALALGCLAVAGWVYRRRTTRWLSLNK